MELLLTVLLICSLIVNGIFWITIRNGVKKAVTDYIEGSDLLNALDISIRQEIIKRLHEKRDWPTDKEKFRKAWQERINDLKNRDV